VIAYGRLTMTISDRPAFLAAFLAAPERPDGTFTYHELQGFLFAVATAPELIRPSEWMPEIFAGEEAVYADMEEVRFVLGEIMNLYNAVNEAVIAGDDVLPTDCVFREEVLANLEEDAAVSQWSRGFAAGYDWLRETWDEYIPDEYSDDHGGLLLVLSYFSSRSLAEAFHRETRSSRTLYEMTSSVRELLPGAAAEFARIGRALGAAVAQAELESRTPRRVVKVGRNDPCPCGSARKYKKCCGMAAPS
jgi:uncharacterized protein